MVNTLLAHWEKSPKMTILKTDSYPLDIVYLGDPHHTNKGGEPDWDNLREKFGPNLLYINYNTPLEWKEVGLTFHSDEIDEKVKSNKNQIILNGAKIDSFTIQAQRRGALQDTNWLETAIYCFTQSPDQKHLLVGTRGGSESVGEFMVVPAGSVPYDPNFRYGNQIENAVMTEGNEEAGILPKEIDQMDLIGAFRQEMGSAAPSHMFLYTSILNVQLQEIMQRHSTAINIYNRAKEACKGSKLEKEMAGRLRLFKESFLDNSKFPVDAWENSNLSLMRNDPTEIIKLTTPVIKEGKMKHGVHGALALYFLHTFGETEYSKLMSIPEFREQINEKSLS